VCKVRDWEEVRVKGEFTNFPDKPKSSLQSKYVYDITVVDKPQTITFTVHQEDERVQDVIRRKPMNAVGLTVLRRTSSGLEIVRNKEYAIERQVEVEVTMEPGEYLVIPRTTGCNLSKSDGT